MTHALSSIIDLTNAPSPPRWFEFLLEPGRLQHHLKTKACDPSPVQLISLFFRNLPDLETTSNIAPIHPITTPSTSNQTSTNQSPSGLTPPTNGNLNGTSSSSSTSIDSSTDGEHTTDIVEGATKVCNGSSNGDANDIVANKTVTNSTPNNKSSAEHTEKLYNDPSDSCDVVIPPDSYEAKYRLRKTYALQTLAVKVASFLEWDLDKICDGLNIPTQYKLVQAIMTACSNDSCPPEIKKFATVIYSHWFLRSAIAYRLSTLQPQSSSTTIYYLSQLQQQQQNADNSALMSMGEIFSDSSKQLKYCLDELQSYIWELAKDENRNTHSAKKIKSSIHPFKKAKLSRPKMECFDSRDEQYNDWNQSEMIDPFEFMEAACYDLGRYLFFEENYLLARETFDIIRESNQRYPLLNDYLQSASDILITDDKPIDDENESKQQSYQLANEIYAKRKQTEKYLFDCMTQYSQTQSRNKTSEEELDNEASENMEEDCDLRFEQQALACHHRLPENNAWYLQVPTDVQQQQLLEMGKGDILMSRGNFKQAMGCFVGALMLMTDYFRVFSKNYSTEESYITRMIQCSISLSCYTQAVALCQMTKHLNYNIAFKQLNERICNDCCDDIYECIWNVTLLEYIINLHAKRGEIERRTKVIQLLGQLELNENNPEEILREAEHVRRGRFFRIMSNKYL